MITYNFGSFKDKEFVYKLSKYLERVFGKDGLTSNISYDDYFKSHRLSINLPSNHNPDYILGLVDGMKHEHEGILND